MPCSQAAVFRVSYFKFHWTLELRKQGTGLAKIKGGVERSLCSRDVAHWASTVRREGIGDASVIGDLRWAGGYGVRADFIAVENCHIAYIKTSDILVAFCAPVSFRFPFLAPAFCFGDFLVSSQSPSCSLFPPVLLPSEQKVVINTSTTILRRYHRDYGGELVTLLTCKTAYTLVNAKRWHRDNVKSRLLSHHCFVETNDAT